MNRRLCSASRDVLALSDASLDDIVKMNLFFGANGEDVKEELHAAMAIWEEMAPNVSLDDASQSL